MNRIITLLIGLSLGWTVLSLSNDQTQFVELEDHIAKSQCSSKCQGDFPTSTDRMYAAAREARGWA